MLQNTFLHGHPQGLQKSTQQVTCEGRDWLHESCCRAPGAWHCCGRPPAPTPEAEVRECYHSQQLSLPTHPRVSADFLTRPCRPVNCVVR